MPENLKILKAPARRDQDAQTAQHPGYVVLKGRNVQSNVDPFATDWMIDPSHFEVAAFLKWSGSTSSAPKSSGTQESSLSLARDLYLKAFEQAVGQPPTADLSDISIDGDRFWRLTFAVDNSFANNIDKLVSVEAEIHRTVGANSPQLAGFFSIQFVPNGQS